MFFQIKKIIPVRLKYIPWYIWKSPQRKLGFWRSWGIEIAAFAGWLRHILGGRYRKRLQPVSICTGIKNRTSQYLDYVLPSILKMAHPELIEISIFDCGSEDVETLKKSIEAQWKGKLVFVSEPLAFTRSYSFNRAIDQCTNSLFFASDADMSLPPDLVALCNRYASAKTVWFPVFFKLFQNTPASLSPENGEWLPESRGMFASTKAQFAKAGRFNLIYKQWGWEDIDLWISYFKAGILPMRTRCKGLIHHWHPSLERKVEAPEHLKKFNF